MSGGKKHCLKLRRRKINSSVETRPEIMRELFRVAALRARQIDDWFSREEETKHGAQAMKRPRHLEIAQRDTNNFLEFHAGRLKRFPRIDPLQFAQLRQSCGHRERIARERAGLINRTLGRQLIHDLGASAERAHRQATADDFAERSEVRAHTEQFLSAAARYPETRHYLIEDQKRAFSRAFFAERLEKIVARKIKTGIRRNWFQNHSRNRFCVFAERRSNRFDVVERKRNGERRKIR